MLMMPLNANRMLPTYYTLTRDTFRQVAYTQKVLIVEMQVELYILEVSVQAVVNLNEQITHSSYMSWGMGELRIYEPGMGRWELPSQSQRTLPMLLNYLMGAVIMKQAIVGGYCARELIIIVLFLD